jgi:hypothetical protein
MHRYSNNTRTNGVSEPRILAKPVRDKGIRGAAVVTQVSPGG